MNKSIGQLIVLALCAAIALAAPPQTGLAAEIRPKTYSSPRAVFDAYREAVATVIGGTSLFVLGCVTECVRLRGSFQFHMHPRHPKVLGVLNEYVLMQRMRSS